MLGLALKCDSIYFYSNNYLWTTIYYVLTFIIYYPLTKAEG